MNTHEPIDYSELDAAVRRLRLGVDASELHGSLCGFLAGGGVPGRRSLVQVLELDGEELAPSPADHQLLGKLTQQAEADLADPELGFELLLPSDDRPLTERAEAMVEWCRGFLGGFGLAGASSHAKLSDEAQEILRDLGAIAASEFDFADEGEDEDALIEVHEFVRVGAMLLHTECASSPAAGNETLH